MHGFAFNVNVDLDFFGHIVPCGISDRGVTSLARERGGSVSDAKVLSKVIEHFETVFDADVERLDGSAARTALADLLGDHADLPRLLRAAA